MNQLVARSGAARNLFSTGLTHGVAPLWRMTMLMSTDAAAVMPEKETEKKTAEAKKTKETDAVASYWGISKRKISREDGTEWPWNCFMPWETYKSITDIDLKKYHEPTTFLDKVAYRTVKILRVPTDIFFQVCSVL